MTDPNLSALTHSAQRLALTEKLRECWEIFASLPEHTSPPSFGQLLEEFEFTCDQELNSLPDEELMRVMEDWLLEKTKPLEQST